MEESEPFDGLERRFDIGNTVNWPFINYRTDYVGIVCIEPVCEFRASVGKSAGMSASMATRSGRFTNTNNPAMSTTIRTSPSTYCKTNLPEPDESEYVPTARLSLR